MTARRIDRAKIGAWLGVIVFCSSFWLVLLIAIGVL